MSLFNFNQQELLSFFAVLVRYSVLFAILPFVGDKSVPGQTKVLLALVVTIALFPALVSSGQVKPGDALVWGASASGIISTITLEVLFALALGFVARIMFDGILMGGNLMGSFMGFSIASTYDSHQESQSQVVAQVQMTLAMLIFLVLDGHHLMLRAALDSYRVVGVGSLNIGFGPAFVDKLIQLSGSVITFGMELAAPIAISLFAVNVVFGVLGKAMPQLNILVLSFAASGLIGLGVLFLSLPEFQGLIANYLGQIGEWMEAVTLLMAKGT
ncbi:MAG TPA: hypothetical protein DCS07_04630 [Bdellovibrionales bacterium]|nr:MAG: hypothetical protein A2Z97_12530 [Bdellovibrionales bacterium GWB1_52_6]OFZ04801.1 MAG: hypothetical protein A2X97_13860 [Bdellovibrionales bacterium GWA1_52_35]OFZ42807.1 MAG: hypothetical protein A2070_05650 [Bdellovibrionales bacterium GWC1_52_8]HAR41906.1 hypothetical protein [Bdellovibrionales bacterium]HCM39621.1 hypothetical protein [Bdellovibrionales bacterium]